MTMKAMLRFSRLSGTALLIFATGASYGCKDFLVAAPQGTLDDQTLANETGVEGSLIAAYRVLDWNNGSGGALWGNAASNWVWGSVTSDDAYKGTEASDAPAVTDIELYNWATGGADGSMNSAWSSYYEGVVRANSTIRLLETVVENDPNAISSVNQNGIRGEALFLRAHYHFRLWQMFGNIPYYVETDEDFQKSNQGVDVVGSLLADLNAAIGLLPNTPRNGDVGRATAWTAKAYKGRVQVYAGQYAEGIVTLQDVRSSGPYALEPNYWQVWTGYSEYANGPETILAYNASANDGAPSGNNANYGERLNFPHSGSPFGCCGFHQPSQNLVNFFQVDAQGLPLALTDNTWNSRDANLDAASSATMALDPRLDWTVGRDGVPYYDWGNHEAGWIRAPSFGGPYSPKKTVYESGSGAMSNVGWVNTQLSSNNIHIFRYADMLLLLAEAYVESGSAGDLELARVIVNEIRARAAVAAQGPNGGPLTVPIDDPSITWANYQVGQYPGPWTDQTYARTAVRYERRLELAMEGKRFFDLKRWGIAEQVLNDYVQVEQTRRPHIAGAATFGSRHYLFPIPSVQIELSKVEGQDMLVQNPGW